MKFTFFLSLSASLLMISQLAHAGARCGKVDGTVSFPAYQFKLSVPLGQAVLAKAVVTTTYYKFSSSAYSTEFEIPMHFDESAGLYSTEASDFEIPHSGGCPDVLNSFRVSFNDGSKPQGTFSEEIAPAEFFYLFPDESTEVKLPPAESIVVVPAQKLTLKSGVFIDATHFKTSLSGEVSTLTWNSKGQQDEDDGVTINGLSSEEVGLIQQSVKSQSSVSIYVDANTPAKVWSVKAK